MRTFKKKGGIQTKKIKDNFQMGIENQWLERENVRERERERERERMALFLRFLEISQVDAIALGYRISLHWLFSFP